MPYTERSHYGEHHPRPLSLWWLLLAFVVAVALLLWGLA